MDKMTVKFPKQHLTMFRRHVQREDGSTADFWSAKLPTVPLNELGATVAEFTGRDLTPKMIAALKPLKVSEGTAKTGEAYKSFGLVSIEAEIIAPRKYLDAENQTVISVRIAPTSIERAEDDSLAQIDAL